MYSQELIACPNLIFNDKIPPNKINGRKTKLKSNYLY